MRFTGGDIGDQGALLIGPLGHGNAQLLAQTGAAAVGQNGQVTLKAGAVLEGQAIAIAKVMHGHHFVGATPADHIFIQGLPQAMAEPGVFHHIAQGRHTFVSGTQACGAEAATVGHMDLRNRLGALADARPDAQALVDLPSAVGQRGGARIVARLITVAGGEGLDQHDLPTAGLGTGLQGQGQAGTHQAAADDRKLYATHQATTARADCASAIRASTSATVLGTPPVRISQPPLVTTTSSSIRTPMPRHFFATFWLSTAM